MNDETNSEIRTVSWVNSHIRVLLESDPHLSHVKVGGEVSNCKYHTSGHVYFSLKDESGSIACVMFRGKRAGLNFRLKDGQQIVATGDVSVYEKSGKYELIVDEIKLGGSGILYERFERLKASLEEMGMFSDEYKMPVPKYATRVGVVTAATGAAIQDIINISRRRNPFVKIILCPALVQGDGAARSIARGIKVLDDYGVDVIIVGRGGGSMEDLWAFNEEVVARAIFSCKTPVISAVGHETDTTIADFVADKRAPTPSAAAELTVFEYRDFADELGAIEYSLKRSMRRILQAVRDRSERQRLKISRLSPKFRVKLLEIKVADLKGRVYGEMYRKLRDVNRRLEYAARQLAALSPHTKLKQGFSYVTDANGKTVKSIKDIKKDDEINIFVTDGAVLAKVIKTASAG